jgi:hypothetical protein
LRSDGPQADSARREISEILDQKGHAVDNARQAIARLERAFDDGALTRTDEVDEVLRDLEVALEQDDGQKLGGKSAEAARFITRRLVRLLQDA